MNYKKPLIQEIGLLELSDFSNYKLENGIDVYELNFPDSAEVVKIDAVYNAGRLYEKNRLSSKICAALIKEGTAQYNSKEIANKLDFYGAYIESHSSMDYSRISVLSLNKHFDKISNLLFEIINKPSFDEKEFLKHKNRAIENLKHQLSKNDVMGYRELTEQLFGANHPYGYNSIESDYSLVSLDAVKMHYNDFYNANNCQLFISGNISDLLRTQIIEVFGSIVQKNNSKHKNPLNVPDVTIPQLKVLGEQSVQKAIFIGGKLFGRNHPDYFGILILNTLLGGYFSSRLNRRIREEEALTYGIDAQLDIMREDGFFYISADVANENEKPVVQAIYEELDRLRTYQVEDHELENVKRYIKGQVLSSLDGPFKQIKVLQSMVINDIEPKTFSDRVRSIDAVNKDDLLRLAQKYYNKEQLVEVIVSGA